MIIQETDKDEPDDLAPGGKFTFKTNGDTELTFLKVGVIDIDEVDVTLNLSSPVTFPGLGDNAFQELVYPDPSKFATSFDVAMRGSGAVAYIVSSVRSSGHLAPCWIA